jgi:pimeloyl-ACP methyl ester carboxylesterase
VIDHFVHINNLRFHYLEWPHDGAQTMLLVHGFAGHALSWDVFAEAMAKHFRVIAIDQRGHGESEWAEEYGTEQSVSDLSQFIEALDLHRIVLVGHSMGGRNSIVYLSRQPEKIDKFILVDMGPELNPAGGRRIREGWQNNQDIFESREQAFQQLRAVNQRPPLEHHRTRVFHGLKQLPDGTWTWKYDKKLRSSGPRPPQGQTPASSVDDYWRMWASIPCPILLVRGGVSDLLARESAEKMARENPHCALVEITGAGHSVPMDRPVEFERSVSEWLHLT